jgi:hypothetical protein
MNKWLNLLRWFTMSDTERYLLMFEFEAWEIFVAVAVGVFMIGLGILGIKWALT